MSGIKLGSAEEVCSRIWAIQRDGSTHKQPSALSHLLLSESSLIAVLLGTAFFFSRCLSSLTFRQLRRKKKWNSGKQGSLLGSRENHIGRHCGLPWAAWETEPRGPLESRGLRLKQYETPPPPPPPLPPPPQSWSEGTKEKVSRELRAMMLTGQQVSTLSPPTHLTRVGQMGSRLFCGPPCPLGPGLGSCCRAPWEELGGARTNKKRSFPGKLGFELSLHSLSPPAVYGRRVGR